MKEFCGLFGVFNHEKAAELTYLGLYALQHRGEEGAGIVASNGHDIISHTGMGSVATVFGKEIISKLGGHTAIGHVRYSTTGSSHAINVQPLKFERGKESIALAHNGNLINTTTLKKELESVGAIFQTTSDSEIILKLLSKANGEDRINAINECLKKIKGAYSLLIMYKDSLVGLRDPNGFRPLCIGRLNDAYIITSESCALDLIEAKFVRDVEPGEMVLIDENGMESFHPFDEKVEGSFCIFEYIYFARPDSNISNRNVHEVRKSLGRRLAKEYPVEVDNVIAVPDSGNSAALGYAKELKTPFEIGIVRNHYVGRAFIQPSQEIRDFDVKIKLNPIRKSIKGKRLVVVDDSIVRGTTTKARVNTLKKAGAKEIHLRISCPPIRYPCYYGIDFPTRKELIAANHTLTEIKEILNVDSLGYLSLEGMIKSVSDNGNQFCTACFTGKYPVPFEDYDLGRIS